MAFKVQKTTGEGKNKPSKLSTLAENSDRDNSKSALSEQVSSRPSCTSKAKVLDQVKQWVTDSSYSTSNNSLRGVSTSVKRKHDDSHPNNSNASNKSDFNHLDASNLRSTTEDLEDYIPSHTMRQMKDTNIEVKIRMMSTEHVEQEHSVSIRQTPAANTTSWQQLQRTSSGTTLPMPGFQQCVDSTTMQLQTDGCSLDISGDMMIPSPINTIPPTKSATSTNFTPQQKILKLTKLGVLSVSIIEQPMERSQNQQQPQPRIQVNIKKVQNIILSTGDRFKRVIAVTIEMQRDGTYTQKEIHPAQFYSITERLIEQDDFLASTQHIKPQLAIVTNEDGSLLLVTLGDGTVYKVAGQTAEGNIILVTQGPDGGQEFIFATITQAEGNYIIVLNYNEAVSEVPVGQQEASGQEPQYIVQTTKEDGTTHVVTMTESELAQLQALVAQQQAAGSTLGGTGNISADQIFIQCIDESNGQYVYIPVEVVQYSMPLPGGARRIVLLLQDGTYVMTDMHDNEFKALNIST